MRVWHGTPCWVLVAPDGEIGAWCREGEWDGSHYGTEADAESDATEAVELDVENEEEKGAARARSLRAVELRSVCHTVVCDGCSTDYEEDEIRIHFLSEETLRSGWTEVGDVQRCRYCPPPVDPDPPHLPGPGEVPLAIFEVPAS